MTPRKVIAIAERKRPDPDDTDADLMVALAKGNLAPLGVLYDRHYESVRQFVLRATLQASDADDIVHDTFMTVVKLAPTFDGRESARPLLIGVAAQLVRRQRQTFARLKKGLASFAASITKTNERTPEGIVRDALELDQVDLALGRMNEGRRLVLLMIVREGLSGEEVSRALGIPVATVWTRLHYARAELRAVVEEGAKR